MAFCVFKLSKTQRKVLSTIFSFLNFVEIIAGFIMVLISLYIYFYVAPMLYSERAEVNFVFMVIGFFGINLMLIYGFGFKICWKCMHQAHKKSTRNLVFFWVCGTFYLLTALAIVAILSRKVYKHVIRSMKHALHIGMQNYLKDPTWKMTLDHLQYTFKCCGIKSYKEWHQIKWLSSFQIDENSDQISRIRAAHDGNLPITPYSCCRIDFPMQCFHDPVQQFRFAHLWTEQPSLVEQSINTTGCIEQLKASLFSTIVIFIVLVIFCWIVQLLIFIVLRILYTSCRNALLLDDPDGPSPGWIWGRGDCGLNRGRTILEIMGGADYLRTRAVSFRQEEGTTLMHAVPPPE